jgi:hypothetical protein
MLIQVRKNDGARKQFVDFLSSLPDRSPLEILRMEWT